MKNRGKFKGRYYKITHISLGKCPSVANLILNNTNVTEFFLNIVPDNYFLKAQSLIFVIIKCITIPTFLIGIETCSALLGNRCLHLIYPLTIMDQTGYCT